MAVTLKVANARLTDVGKGIVRIDVAARRKLKIKIGDVVQITGRRKTVAIVWSAYNEDEGLGIIRMDGIIRKNAMTSLGEKVKVEKIEEIPAKKVVLAQQGENIKASENLATFIKGKLIGYPITKGDEINIPIYYGKNLKFRVLNLTPRKAVKITPLTRVLITQKKIYEGEHSYISYEDIGGLQEEKQRIREMVELPLKHPELFQKLGIEPPRGVLLFGPPGCGKTMLAKAVANETEASFFAINGPEIMSKYYGESEKKLREVFMKAKAQAPSIIFIDELDAIAPSRDKVMGEVERRVVAQLLALLDGLEPRGKVVVIGASNRPNAIDIALRRPGRFDREIEIGVPDEDGRLEILQIHTRNMPLSKDVNLRKLAKLTQGFAGADISALTKEAALIALRRYIPQIDIDEDEIPPEVAGKLEVREKDFLNALKRVRPSVLREIFYVKPKVRLRDVGGLHKVKRLLKETVEIPLKKPETFEELGIKPPKGVLLFGPPGCGKTMLAKAIANELNVNFIPVKGPEIMSKWVGESEKAIREIFRKARLAAPSIIFFDEIDSITSKRGREFDSGVTDRVVSQLLTEMDGLDELEKIIVMGATNRIDVIDQAFLRPGRFDKLILVPAPDYEDRLEILRIITSKMKLKLEVDFERIAKLTEGYSGSDLEALCREVAYPYILKKRKGKIRTEDFEEAMQTVTGSLPPQISKWYESFLKTHRKRMIEAIAHEVI